MFFVPCNSSMATRSNVNMALNCTVEFQSQLFNVYCENFSRKSSAGAPWKLHLMQVCNNYETTGTVFGVRFLQQIIYFEQGVLDSESFFQQETHYCPRWLSVFKFPIWASARKKTISCLCVIRFSSLPF